MKSAHSSLKESSAPHSDVMPAAAYAALSPLRRPRKPLMRNRMLPPMILPDAESKGNVKRISFGPSRHIPEWLAPQLRGLPTAVPATNFVHVATTGGSRVVDWGVGSFAPLSIRSHPPVRPASKPWGGRRVAQNVVPLLAVWHSMHRFATV